MIHRSRLLPLAALLLAGCTSSDLRPSEWLGPDSGFESRGPDLRVQPPSRGADLARYRRIHVDRVHMFLEPGSAGRALPETVQRSLAAGLRGTLREELGEHYELVQDLGQIDEDVLRIRGVITDLELADPEAGTVASATVEVELVDGVSGERVAAAISRRPARKVTGTVEEGLAEADLAFAAWATNLRLWLDDLMGT